VVTTGLQVFIHSQAQLSNKFTNHRNSCGKHAIASIMTKHIGSPRCLNKKF